MIATDWHGAVLALNAATQGECIVFSLSPQGTDYMSLLGINDEGIDAHRLRDRGLAGVVAGRILNSRRVAELRASSPNYQDIDFRHYILPLKESVAEFICAGEPDVKQMAGKPMEGALAVLETFAE